MSMRTCSIGIAAAALALLAGCGQAGDDPRVAAGTAADGQGARGRIACRMAGMQEYRDACTAERTAKGDGQLLTLRAPDGGFRRLRVDADGSAIAAADGAEPAAVTRTPDGGLEIVIGGDAYRLPAAR